MSDGVCEAFGPYKWRCQREAGHLGRHRYRNYTFSTQTDTRYEPIQPYIHGRDPDDRGLLSEDGEPVQEY